MKHIKYGLIFIILFLTSCSYAFQSTTTTTTTEKQQETIDLTGSDSFHQLYFGEKRIYNQEIKRNTLINTNIDISTIDYLFIEYSIYHIKGNQTISFIITKETIENGFFNDYFEVYHDEDNETIKIKTRETIKHIIVTPVKIASE